MLETLLAYHWEIFIGLEIASVVFLIAFLVIRYAFTNQKLSSLFLFLFVLCLGLEASLAFFVYQRTGEISTFTIVITIFIVYAFTFGISDFKKLDRYIKHKIGTWRGVNLLTKDEIRKMEQARDPQVIAQKARIWWYTHAALFVIAHIFFWMYYGNHANSFLYYVTDLSWWGDAGFENSPFTNGMVAGVSKLWTLVIAIDTVISWSYTVFPAKKKT